MQSISDAKQMAQDWDANVDSQMETNSLLMDTAYKLYDGELSRN
jgi:hypothetical protein